MNATKPPPMAQCKLKECKKKVPTLFGGSPPYKYQTIICPDCISGINQDLDSRVLNKADKALVAVINYINKL